MCSPHLFAHRVRKILNLRVFEDDSGKHWSKSVMDKQFEVLCVSQFTLQCVLKGSKPDFHLAMPAEQAEGFYNSFLEQLRKTYRPELIKGGCWRGEAGTVSGPCLPGPPAWSPLSLLGSTPGLEDVSSHCPRVEMRDSQGCEIADFLGSSPALY